MLAPTVDVFHLPEKSKFDDVPHLQGKTGASVEAPVKGDYSMNWQTQKAA